MILLPPISLLVSLCGLILTCGVIQTASTSLSSSASGSVSSAYFSDSSGLFMPEATVINKCRHMKIRNYLHAECSKLNLKHFPNLNKDIEILDFSENKLREINDNTLSKYTSLISAYFTENFIKSISDNAFIYLKNLQVLDLTNNGLVDFPKNIIGLSSLKILFLSKNSLTDSALEPTSYAEDSIIEKFDLSENHLTKLPQLGYLTELQLLNLSYNEIKYVKVSNISMYCSLKVLDLRYNPITFSDKCECQAFNEWIITQNIKMFPPTFTCDNKNQRRRRRRDFNTFKCTSTQTKDNKIFKEAFKKFEQCRNILETRKIRKIAMITGISIAGFVILLVIIGFCIRRRKRNKLRKIEKQKQLTKEQKEINATDELLNGVPEQNN